MKIQVSYDTKLKRLVMNAPFMLVDVMRGYPTRKFDPRTKTWRMPLLKANVAHFQETRHLYPYVLDEAATDAVARHVELTAKPVHVPFPRTYDFQAAAVPYRPMEHQFKMLDLAWGLKSAAWVAKMGTGKTYAAIHLAFARWYFGQIDGVMVICPSTLRATWRKELAKFATGPYDFREHETRASWMREYCDKIERGKLQFLAVSVEGLGISEASYDSACAFFKQNRRVLTICDESSRIKNPEAKRTQRTVLLGSCSEYRLFLNGTPVALGIQDLYAQYDFLDPNIIGIGDYWSFRTRYLEMGGWENKQIVGYKNTEELMDLILPYTVEVGKDVLNLPEKVMVQRPVQITPEQRNLIRLVVKGSNGDPNAPQIKVENSLEKMLRCRQIVGGWLPKVEPVTTTVDGVPAETWETKLVPLDKNPKLDMLMELIDDNFSGSKFIIWSTFVHEIEAIRDKLAKQYGPESVECYYGSTAMEDRSRIEDRYCRDPSMRFFVANPATAGLGLTLISGENDVMVYYSGTNAYIDRAQSEDRAHRLGQKNNVTIVDLVAEGTIDMAIIESIKQKMSVEEYVYDRIKKGISIDKLLLGEEY